MTGALRMGLFLSSLAICKAAAADPVSVVSSLRVLGCDGLRSAGGVVVRDVELDIVARELSRHNNLERALDRTGYPAASATSYHVRGSTSDQAIRETLEPRFCSSLTFDAYELAGFHQDGNQSWIVLAARLPAPPSFDDEHVATRVLDLVNVARASARRCGREDFAAAEPVTLSPFLTAAAFGHAVEMAERGVVTHDGLDGSNVADRVNRTGYRWRGVGENVAGGQRDAAAVVAAWIGSPGHCATLMGPEFTEMGIAVRVDPDKNPDTYWVQVFAVPLPTSR